MKQLEEPVEASAPDDPGPDLYEPPHPRRSMSAGDALRLLIALAFLGVGLLLAWVAERTIEGVEGDIVDAVERLPDRFEQALLGSAQVIASFIPIVAVIAIVWNRRWRLLLSVLLASNLAGWLTDLLIDRFAERRAAGLLAERAREGGWLVTADFPTTAYLAGATALVTVGASWLPRRWRRAAWSWVVVLVALRLLGPGEPPLDVWVAVSMGVVVGSVVLLLLGSPNAEPEPHELYESLRDAGLDPRAIRRRLSGNGRATFTTVERDGHTTFVKLRTPDDRSSDLLNRLYRAIRLRSSEVAQPYSTLKRRVEHEALALRTARAAGARVPRVVTIGMTEGGSAYLVQDEVVGRAMSDMTADEIDDDLLRDVWSQIRAMHSTRTAHHHLTLDNVIVDPTGAVWLVDLDESELAAPERQRNRDVAEMLVATALVVGRERAVRTGVEVLGSDPVAASLPLLQPLALSGALGRELRRHRDLFDVLRAEIHDQTGADDVPLEQLARIKPRTLVMVVALSLAFYTLLPQLANLDDTWDAVTNARLGWFPALLAASAAYFVFATISFLGSVTQPMPVAASLRSQVASAFAQLVGPATAGRMALAVRFLQRSGVPTAEASASVALNSSAGIVTHLLLLVSFIWWAGGADVGGFSLPDSDLVLVVICVGVAVVIVASIVGPVRRAFILPVWAALRTAAGHVGRVFRSPIRVIALLGGSTCITLSYLVALVFSVEAFGGGLSVAQIGAAYLAAAAIANIAPTPGGLGALEAAMIAALSGFGLDNGVAVSSVLTFRLATFWLPILPGWLTFLWMERHDEI